MKSAARRNGMNWRDIPWRPGSKHKRRKRSYLPGWHSRRDATMLNRRDRHKTKQDLHD